MKGVFVKFILASGEVRPAVAVGTYLNSNNFFRSVSR